MYTDHLRAMESKPPYFVCSLDQQAQQNLDDSVLQEGLATMLGAPESTTCDYVQEDSPPFPLLRLEEEDDEDKEPFVDTWLPHTSCVSEAIPTPPPDSSPRFASTEESASLTHCESFVKGSSLDETPASSPGCNSESEDCTVKVKVEYTSEEDQSNRLSLKRSRSGSEEDSSEEEELPLPKNLKLPQRKGGMQLWQFLYTLLTDPKKCYSELIEWTDKEKHREFRLQEPEAIAIWWGEHKNKKNMSYDKLSRSLRYYYDKGIIRKISGERYVYQFCVDPEMMYEHIGISESRPKLKPMPLNARLAMSKYQQEHTTYGMTLEESYKMMGGIPAPMQFLQHHRMQHPHLSQIFHPVVMSPSSTSLPPMPPPPLYDTLMLDTNPLLDYGCFSGPSPVIGDFKPPLLKRHSAPSCMLESKQPHSFLIDQQFQAQTTTSLTFGVSVDHLHSVSLSSSQLSPLSTHTYASDSDELELDELIALTSGESYNHSPSALSSASNSPFLSISHGIDSEMPPWNFN